ncbi:hypothetical protein DQ04_00501060 [Trypanosoma grayi]|uniref:hypothetical protein n=1 Tax=Trypanosoma grayi TaxID=71804 RepID=UPI0004F453BD|nr:hypothetical protein DQ04_00501060 [Trypanosoma grayi]KEG14366.1 hypothetical protein DQ04_00501060 [Trypanosoma grayi]
MDLQECIQHVMEYRPSVDGGTVDASPLLAALQHLITAVTDVDQLGDGLRPLVKALVTAAVHLPERWDDILQALRGVLANSTVPWPHRAFLLRTLPAMLDAAPGEAQRPHSDALCEVLVRWSLPSPGAEECDSQESAAQQQHHAKQQERRVALSALLSLPPECATSVVAQLTAQLPNSLSTCVAVVTNPSAHDALKRAFEAWLCGVPASPQTAQIEKTLRENFRGYGAARCEQLCTVLISREPLRSAEGLPALQEDLSALVAADASHSGVVSKRLSLAFLFEKAVEVVSLVYAPERPHLQMTLEASAVPLSVIRTLVQLTDEASVTPDSISSEEMRKLCVCLMVIDSADAALDAPLPLLECVLHLVLRALPCAPATDEGARPLLAEIAGIAGTLLPVMEDAVLKVHSAEHLLREQKESTNGKTQTEGELKEENAVEGKQAVNSAEMSRQSAFVAAGVAQTVAQLCRICRRRRQGNGDQQQEQQEGISRKWAEDVAAAARTTLPSWKREKEGPIRRDTLTLPQSRQAAASPALGKKELQQARRPSHSNKGGGNRPFKRRRRDARLL